MSNARAAAAADAVCDRLEWDSAFFGVPIARVRTSRLTGELARAIDAWAEAHDIRCLYFLADLAHTPTVRLAEDHGYHLVDVRLTYEARLADVQRVLPPSEVPAVRLAVREDIPAFRDISRHSYPGTRFYHDPNFSEAQCDELYATWIERSVHGFADRVFTIGPAGAPFGYATCHRDGRMGLAAVRPDMRGHGYGLALYQAAFDWFLANRIEPIVLHTQGANVPGQRIAQRLGCRVAHAALWYHRWR